MEKRSESFQDIPSTGAGEPAQQALRSHKTFSVCSNTSSDADDVDGEHSTDRLAVTSTDDSSSDRDGGVAGVSRNTRRVQHDPYGRGAPPSPSQRPVATKAPTTTVHTHTSRTNTTAASAPSLSTAPRASEGRDDGGNGGEALAPRRPEAVGLINEGCTCYLNSLLQLLFHLGYFRTAVYRIPVAGDDGPSVYKALQETFFQMQERTTPARTNTLTSAFGWGKRELYVQHDIQEMATLLRDNLEERMKGTVTEGAIDQLFEGRGEQVVETLDQSYVSRRADTFYDIHIPLGQHSTLLGSLTSLTARDQLIGDNKYKVEREGKPPVYMDAEKRYSYTRFPPVTWFHLKRFAMDLTSPTLEMRKVNAPLEFPVELDLRALEKPGASVTDVADVAGTGHRKVGSAVVPFNAESPAIYDLQGVIVHRGTVRSGHYYCYIHDWDPVAQHYTRWLEYDDESVREVPEDVAVRANYGRSSGSSNSNAIDSFRHDNAIMGGANAYILSYVRRGDAPSVLAPSPTDIVSDRVKEAMRRAIQEEERQMREAEEARLSANLCCLTDASLSAYCNTACCTHLYTRDSHQWHRYADCVFTVRKANTLPEIYEAAAAQPTLARRGVTAQNCRLWRCTDVVALRPSIAFPTYAECVSRRGKGGCNNKRTTSVPAGVDCLLDYLTADEENAPLTLCLYVEVAQVPLPGLRGVTKEIGFIDTVYPDGAGRCYTVKLTRPLEVKALHVTYDTCDYATTVEYVVTADKETLPVALVNVPAGDNTAILPLQESHKTLSVTLKCYVPGARHLPVRDVHLELSPHHPLLQPPPSTVVSLQPTLPCAGVDRALIFFKYFDYATSTVKYVGSRLLDRAAKLSCCAAVYRDFLGLAETAGDTATTVEAENAATTASATTTVNASSPSSDSSPVSQTLPSSSNTNSSNAAAPPSLFRYFIERGDHTLVELNELTDFGDVMSGAVIVAQLRAVPAPFRNLCVRNYYRDLRNSLDAHIIEVHSAHLANDEAYKQSTLEQQRVAKAAASGAAAKKSTVTSCNATPVMTSVESGPQPPILKPEDSHGSVNSPDKKMAVPTTVETRDGAAPTKHAGGEMQTSTGSIGSGGTGRSNGATTTSLNTYDVPSSSSAGGMAGVVGRKATTAATETGNGEGGDTSAVATAQMAPATSSSSATAVFKAVVESDPTRIAATLNPYEAVQLQVLHEAVVETLPSEHYCHLLFGWSYEAVCAAIGNAIGHDPSRIQLYQNCSTSEPRPDTTPTPFNNAVTVVELLHLDAYSPTSVLFYERLRVPREQQQQTGVVTLTLRDRNGHALHRESFTVKLAGLTRQQLVRLMRQAMPAWQREADPWGTVQDTLQASHYALTCVDAALHQIASIHEVPMSKAAGEESPVDPSWPRRFDLELQAAAPLQGSERRIACCHMNYNAADRSSSSSQRIAFGQPFLITVDSTTTVRDALEIMLLTTHLPKDVLHNSHGYGIMMMAGQIYHFENWDEHVHLYWVHTKNTSPYVPSLMLNHSKPREKPGSRYVAQHNPQLKISNK